MDVYRSSLPLPGIFRRFHLFPSAHAPPKLDPEESLSMESYIDSSVRAGAVGLLIGI